VPDSSRNNRDELDYLYKERLGSKIARANRKEGGREGACPSGEAGCEGQRTQV